MSRLEELNKFDDRELLARVLQAEAGNQGVSGKLAVGSVIRNRVQEPGYGDSVRDVITQPGQFSPVNYYTGYAGGEQGVDFEKIRPDEDTYAVADAILTGRYEDPTGGATHFYNPDISNPDWGREKAGGDWMGIGSHIFGRANAGREDYEAPTSNQTTEARRAQYGLGDRDPGTTLDVLKAVQSGDMTKDEAQKYVSEELLQGVEGGSAYDTLQDEKISLGDFMASMEALEQVGRAPETTVISSGAATFPNSRTNLLSARARSARPGSQAIGRLGLESLLANNPLLGIR